MGKLFIGRYGSRPDAESRMISLIECQQRLGMRPSDFVSAEEPDFFQRSHGTHAQYMVFLVDAEEIGTNATWKAGYYLLPLEARDVLRVFDKNKLTEGGRIIKPVEIEAEETPPPAVSERALRWADSCQPLFFECPCEKLLLHLNPPWGFRRHWKARLICPGRCQPPIKKDF